MKKFASILFILLTTSVFSQVKVSGKFVSKNNVSLVLSEVLATSKDSTIIKRFIENGTFKITVPAGWCKLQVRQANKIVFTSILELISDTDIGTKEIENTTELQTVFVEGKKKLIERKIDRLIFNVENSTASGSGGDALEVLKVTPGVKVQSDKVTIIGKSTLSVMIDDKLLPLSDTELANYLKSIPSEGIKSIEVITTPPAKYDASGNSGLINIKLKKAKENSWNALIGTTYQRRSSNVASPKALFNFNKNKLTLSSLVNYVVGSKNFYEDEKNDFPLENWDYSSILIFKFKRIAANLGIEYQLTPWSLLGTQVFYNNINQKTPDNPQTLIYDNASSQLLRKLTSNGLEDRARNFKSLNLYNEILLDTIGKKVTLNFDYFDNYMKLQRNATGQYIINSPLLTSYFTGDNINNQIIKNFSGKVDIELPFKFLTLSLGSKISRSITNNDISFYNSGFVTTPISIYATQKNGFDYTEDIRALYVSGNKKFNSKWESQLGLRIEATQTLGYSVSLDQTTKNRYAKLFPTFYLTYTASENSTFSLSYNKRVSRPGFDILNPNVYQASPFQSVAGNPFLQPAFVDNAELVYTYKNLENKIYFSHEENMFGQLFDPNATTQQIKYINENHQTTNRIGISESYIFDKLKWWTSNNAFDLNYSKSSSSSMLAIEDQKGLSSRISSSNDFNLNSKKTWVFNLNYWYAFAGIDGITKTLDASSLSATLQHTMFDKNLKFSLKFDDILRTEVERISYSANGVSQKYRAYYDYQGLYFSVTFKFGNKKIKPIDRELGNEDEKGRIGN